MSCEKGLYGGVDIHNYPVANHNQLKCSGDKDGCAGCLSNKLECTYHPPGRGNNGALRRSRRHSHMQARIPGAYDIHKRPPSAGSRDSPTPRLSTSSSTTSLEIDLDPLPWPSHTFSPPETTETFLDSFWKDIPTSSANRSGESAYPIFPDTDTDTGHDLFFDPVDFSPSKWFCMVFED